jgi:hypothetical protein
MPPIRQDCGIIGSHERNRGSIPDEADLQIVNDVHRLREDSHSHLNRVTDLETEKTWVVDSSDRSSRVGHLNGPLGRLLGPKVLK